MNELVCKGKQTFLGKEIPVIEGGFGEGQKVISDKTISEIHNMENKNVRSRITDNIRRFRENIDYIDLQNCCLPDKQQFITESLGYSLMQVSKAEHIYLLSERGYAKLIKIMDSDLAWGIHDKLMDEYFSMREIINSISEEDKLALQVIKSNTIEMRAVALSEYRMLIVKPFKEIIETQKPLVEFATAVTDSKTAIEMSAVAKLLDYKGIGRNRLFDILRANEILRPNNEPYQSYIDKGWFRVIESKYTKQTGDVSISLKTLVLQK